MASAYTDKDWPHGLRCAKCERLFTEGMPICEQLQSFIDDVPVVLIVCAACDVEMTA